DISMVDHYHTDVNTWSFFPQFLVTMRHHDYPFIVFSENKILETMPVSETSSSQSASALISEHYEVIESRKAELMSDMKTFETLVKIINDDIKNDKLYETYKTLRQSLVDETIACNEALNARRQQQT
ncbi:3725_t:CDS:2, partial [Ambispora gerdemannii]